MHDDTAQTAVVVAGDVVLVRHCLRGGRGREENVVLTQGLLLLDLHFLHRVGGVGALVRNDIGQEEERKQQGIGLQNLDLVPELLKRGGKMKIWIHHPPPLLGRLVVS
jgi:hypothetical protein